MRSAEVPTPELPPVHPAAPRVFESVRFCLDVVFDEEETARSLLWEGGTPRWAPGRAALSVTGPRAIVIPYLCGQLDSHHLFRATSVKGDVASLSALHGLTHHRDVERFWATRHGEIETAVLAARPPRPLPRGGSHGRVRPGWH